MILTLSACEANRNPLIFKNVSKIVKIQHNIVLETANFTYRHSAKYSVKATESFGIRYVSFSVNHYKFFILSAGPFGATLLENI